MEQLVVYQCPYPKIRAGPMRDGGYVMCIMPGTYDAFLSGGIGDNVDFERHVLDMHPNLRQCVAFDGTIAGLPVSDPRIAFVRQNLGDANDASATTDLHPYLKDARDVLLKIDIEGHEFRLLPAMIKNGDIRRIKQLVLEVHTPADIQLFPRYFAGLAWVTQGVMDATLKGLNETHRLVHLHGNNGCGMHVRDGISTPNVFECTYVRADADAEWTPSRDAIPSPLDRPNVTDKPDLALSGWPFTNR